MVDRLRVTAMWWVLMGVVWGTGCVVSDEADCTSDADCAADQRCLRSGGLLARDGVCVGPGLDGPMDVGPDAEPRSDAEPRPETDTGALDTGPETDIPSSCEGEEQYCGGACVDIRYDSEHCGGCDQGCETGRFCVEGICFDDCDESLDDRLLCGAQCINPMIDVAHCGDCDAACLTEVDNAVPLCTAGNCDFECVDGFEKCETDRCIDVNGDHDEHCGACNISCASDEYCDAGSCEPLPCFENNAPFGGGDGSEDDPYTICTADHLNAVRQELGGQYFALHADIDLESQSFTPIRSNASTGFEGYFDGRGHAIEQLSIVQPNSADLGLFGIIEDSSWVRNLNLERVEITGSERVGAVAGQNRGSIEAVTVDAEVHANVDVGALVGINDHSGVVENAQSAGQVKGSERVGGLVGENAGTIVQSSGAATVDGDSELIGGLVGVNRDADQNVCTIIDSEATGSVTADGAQAVGGLVGGNFAYCSIEGSLAAGDVMGSTSQAVGGLVGWSRPFAQLLNVEASGHVVGENFVGGLVGRLSSIAGEDWEAEEPAVIEAMASGDVSGQSTVGGLVGLCEATIEHALSSGMVTGSGENTGGLVGHLRITDFGTYGKLHDTQAQGDVVGEERVGGLVGLHDGELLRGHASGTVTGTAQVGGLVGVASVFETGGFIPPEDRWWSVIEESSATGDVEAQKLAGGLVGEHHGHIRGSLAAGAVEVGESDAVGGLVGRMTLEATVEDAYAIGGVTGGEVAGGLVGVVDADSGWPFPMNESGWIRRCYAAGLVVSIASEVGGLVGLNESIIEDGNEVEVDHCYWNEDTSGVDFSDGGVGLTDSQFEDLDSFDGFDFESVWEMASERPVLQWENQ